MNYRNHKSTNMKTKYVYSQRPEIVNRIKYIETNYDFGIIIDKSEKNLWLKIFDTYMYDTCVISENEQFINNKYRQNIRFINKYTPDEKHRIVLLNEKYMYDIVTHKPNHLWLILDDISHIANIDISMANIITLKKPSPTVSVHNIINHNPSYNDKLMIHSANKQIKTDEQHECVICYDTSSDIIQTHCGHYFCKDCILKNFKFSDNCPLCRTSINNNNLSYTNPLNENKYNYVCRFISNLGMIHKLLFCSYYDNVYMTHFLNKYENVKPHDKWFDSKTGCTFINTQNINTYIISFADEIIFLDDHVNDNIIQLIKSTQNVKWHLNTCS